MNGTVCSRNVRQYAPQGNPPADFVFDRPNDRRKLEVFAAITGNNVIIGPVFVDGTMTGRKFLDIINQELAPELTRRFQLQRNGRAIQRVWLVQDGAPCHGTVAVRRRLQELFPGRVIGMDCDIDWPARSPDSFCGVI